jgi:membrane fusion protein, multidrug efflux system
MTRNRFAFLVLAIAALFFVSSCGKTKKTETPFFAVSVTESVRGDLNNYIELNGDVETQTGVDVYADTIGKLSRLYVHVGEKVQKDAIIAEVDPSRPGSTFVASPVRSPIAGTITAIPSQIGATIMTGVPIAKMAATDLIQVRTNVAERFVASMRVGLDGILSFDAYPGIIFKAIVTEVSPVLDPSSRSLEVKLRLQSSDIRIKPGMFARVKIVTDSKQGIVKIPSDAVVRRFEDNYVFVVKEKKESVTGFVAERRKVTPGIDIDEKREITSGLAAGEKVIVQGQTLLEDQAAIKIISTIPPLSTDDPIL